MSSRQLGWIALVCAGLGVPLAAWSHEPLHAIFQSLPSAKCEQDIWDQLSVVGKVPTPKRISKKSEFIEIEGFVVPAAKSTKLWVLADEGVDIIVVDYWLVPPRLQRVWPAERFKRWHPPNQGRLTLREIRYPFREGEMFRLLIEYANMGVGDTGDPEGVTLIATDGGARVVGTLAIELSAPQAFIGDKVVATATLKNADGAPAANEQLLFRISGDAAGTARTRADGTAQLVFTATQPGEFLFTVRSLSNAYGAYRYKPLTVITATAPAGKYTIGADPAKLLSAVTELQVQGRRSRDHDTITSAGWMALGHLTEYLNAKAGDDVEMPGIPVEKLSEHLWYQFTNEYRGPQGNQATLQVYRLLTGHLKLARHLLAQPDPAKRRIGLGIAWRGAQCAITYLRDPALGVAICDGILLPQLAAADSDPATELSEQLILATVAEIYAAAGQTQRQEGILQMAQAPMESSNPTNAP